MERSKGTIRFIKAARNETDNIVGWVDMANHGVLTVAANANIDKEKAKANAAHLVACWNAFEDGGLVGEMRDACKKAQQFIENGVELGYITLPDKPDTALETLPILKAVLARAAEEGMA